MSVAIITGSLAPYTHRLYDAFARGRVDQVHVLVCDGNEPHRQWSIGAPEHYTFHRLGGWRYHASYTRHVYVNPSVITALARLRPGVIILEGFSPTMALAAIYARMTRTPYLVKTDGHRAVDPGETSRVHRWMRRFLIPRAAVGIGASTASTDLLGFWGQPAERLVVVPIVTAWPAPASCPTFEQRPFDILFAGALNEPIKGARFFLDVMAAVKQRGVAPKVRIAGDGPMRQEMEVELARLGLSVQFDGALQPEQMADVYASARLLQFPSRGDAWGLVANEAVFCGTPVIGSPHAVSSELLVERYGVGLMRPLDVNVWADAVVDMLSSRERWDGFMVRRADVVRDFGLDASVAALSRAVDMARGKV